jgi:hypothetical protein
VTRRRRVLLAVLVLDLLILAGVWGWYRGTAPRRIADRAGIIPRAAQLCREHGAEFLAFHSEQAWRAVSQLPSFLASQRAPWQPLQLRQWLSGHLSATMGPLGIRIGSSWMPPLMAVLEPSGEVVWRAQGVTDWGAIPCGT